MKYKILVLLSLLSSVPAFADDLGLKYMNYLEPSSTDALNVGHVSGASAEAEAELLAKAKIPTLKDMKTKINSRLNDVYQDALAVSRSVTAYRGDLAMLSETCYRLSMTNNSLNRLATYMKARAAEFQRKKLDNTVRYQMFLSYYNTVAGIQNRGIYLTEFCVDRKTKSSEKMYLKSNVFQIELSAFRDDLKKAQALTLKR